MTKLSVEDVHLTYGANPILKGVSLDLAAGEVVVLLGPSGSGKTTLLRAIAGLEQPQSGRIRLDGSEVFGGAPEIPAEKRNLGVVFQSYALWPHRSVFDNVAYGLKLRNTPAAETSQRVEKALKELGLLHLKDRFPHQLSGGQQQRVAIARALVYNPPVLLLDEPLSNLDAKLRDEAKAWLRSLIVESGISAIVVTHDQAEAMAMADRIILLNEGRIEQQGTPEAIYTQPATLFAAEFFGANNRLEGVVRAGDGKSASIAFEGFELNGRPLGTLRAGERALGIIRVEALRLADGPGPNRIELPCVTSMFAGDRWQHVLKASETVIRAYGAGKLRKSAQWIEFPQETLWLFPRAVLVSPETK